MVDFTVEDLLEIVRKLPPDASAVKAVLPGLRFIDSGALAALLKELNKSGHSRRAQEIFDWLRALENGSEFKSLCNTMTYTTMISQCGTQQALRRALELVAEMRSRGIPCNVHTYSALMNVCIKGSELDLALDVYRQMLNQGIIPNLVTYNTLIDVYGKTGAWQEAVSVLDALSAQGIEPEIRTYNTAIIACNMSGQAGEALKIYERMLAAGAQPTATTYTALISAYGKSGQLEKALGIFQDMVCRGCERNVITYSSLISACEKAGKWELALDLFREMHAEGCRPNVVTFNSLIAACAQGAQWEKALDLFESMPSRNCRPDAVTYGGLIVAFDRAGEWRRALAAFENMRASNCRPDSVVYNTIIGSLWRTGLLWAQSKAAQIFHSACRAGHFRLTVHTVNHETSDMGSSGNGSDNDSGSGSGTPLACSSSIGSVNNPCPFSPSTMSTTSQPSTPFQAEHHNGGVIEFGIHAFTIGSAVLSVMRWVSELRERLPREWSGSADHIRYHVALTINKGKPSRDHAYPVIRECILSLLSSWDAPFNLLDVRQGARLEASAADVTAWLAGPHADAALAYFQGMACPHESLSSSQLEREAFFQNDLRTESQCCEAFAAVRQLEQGYRGKGNGIPEPYASQRAEWACTAFALSEALGLMEDVPHDCILLVDRAMAAIGPSGNLMDFAPAAVIAAGLQIAAAQAGENPQQWQSTSLEQLTGVACEDINGAQAAINCVLHGNTSAISAMRVLKLYLERLGADSGRQDSCVAAGGDDALRLLDGIPRVQSLRDHQPSLIAAATLFKARQMAGKTPFWPQALMALTGLSEVPGGQLAETVELLSLPL